MSLSNRTKFLCKLHPAIRLYLVYLATSFAARLVNLLLKYRATELIEDFSADYEPLVAYTESVTMIFAKSLAVVLTIYVVILVVRGLLKSQKVGYVLYFVLALLVGFASGTNWGGGLLSYQWSSNLMGFFAGQLEWFGGALLICSSRFGEFRKVEVFVGLVLISFSSIINIIIL